jgi:hypothetical protein
MLKHSSNQGSHSRRWAGAVFATLAALALSPEVSAGPKPIGLGCPSGYKLLFEGNLLTCKRVLNSGSVLKTATPSCSGQPKGTVAGPELLVRTGVDACASGSSKPSSPAPTPITDSMCPADYFLKVDGSGKADQCQHFGYDYQAPVNL